MNKLEIVKQSLETNPNIVITDIFDQGYYTAEKWAHFSEFFVAPKKGLYKAKELQKFMMGLVPEGLKPTRIDNFEYENGFYTGNKLCLGKLFFDEKIGEKYTITIEKITDKGFLTNETFLNSYGEDFVNGRSIEKELEPYERRTKVSLFPNKTYARDAFLDKDKKISVSGPLPISGVSIELKELEKYQNEEQSQKEQ